MLLVDQGAPGPAHPDRVAAERVERAPRPVERIRQRCVLEGLEAALERRKRSRERSRVLDGEAEARRVAIACSEPPEGGARGTLRLLADALKRRRVVASVSHETVRQVLKNTVKPWQRRMWCIPPKQDAAFVCAMEQALDGYARRPDPSHPVVRMDETTKQCVKETRTPQPTAPGRAARYDAEYERNGVAHLLLYYAPLENGRRVDAKADHVATTWAEGVRQLVGEDFPEAERITLVMDNLNPPRRRLAIQGVSGAEGAPAAEQASVRVHAQARELAE